MGKKVLVVDDEPGIRNVLTTLLRDEGFEVNTAADGQHALELLPRERPDLVIVDLMMPGIDGRALVRTMDEKFGMGKVPVIFMSAAPAAHDGQHGGRAAAFVSKPFDLDQLLGTVNSMLA